MSMGISPAAKRAFTIREATAAMADASRRQLLDRLREKTGLTLNELCEGHDMSRQAVSEEYFTSYLKTPTTGQNPLPHQMTNHCGDSYLKVISNFLMAPINHIGWQAHRRLRNTS